MNFTSVITKFYSQAVPGILNFHIQGEKLIENVAVLLSLTPNQVRSDDRKEGTVFGGKTNISLTLPCFSFIWSIFFYFSNFLGHLLIQTLPIQKAINTRSRVLVQHYDNCTHRRHWWGSCSPSSCGKFHLCWMWGLMSLLSGRCPPGLLGNMALPTQDQPGTIFLST